MPMSGDAKKVIVTNDGATILKSIPVDNAAAKIIIDTSKTQDAEVSARRLGEEERRSGAEGREGLGWRWYHLCGRVGRRDAARG